MAAKWDYLDTAEKLTKSLKESVVAGGNAEHSGKWHAKNPWYRPLTTDEKAELAGHLFQSDDVYVHQKYAVLVNWAVGFLLPTKKAPQFKEPTDLVSDQPLPTTTTITSNATDPTGTALNGQAFPLRRTLREPVLTMLTPLLAYLARQAPEYLQTHDPTDWLARQLDNVLAWWLCLVRTDMTLSFRALAHQMGQCLSAAGDLLAALAGTLLTDPSDISDGDAKRTQEPSPQHTQALVLTVRLIQALATAIHEALAESSAPRKAYELMAQELLPTYAKILYWLPRVTQTVRSCDDHHSAPTRAVENLLRATLKHRLFAPAHVAHFDVVVTNYLQTSAEPAASTTTPNGKGKRTQKRDTQQSTVPTDATLVGARTKHYQVLLLLVLRQLVTTDADPDRRFYVLHLLPTLLELFVGQYKSARTSVLAEAALKQQQKLKGTRFLEASTLPRPDRVATTITAADNGADDNDLASSVSAADDIPFQLLTIFFQLARQTFDPQEIFGPPALASMMHCQTGQLMAALTPGQRALATFRTLGQLVAAAVTHDLLAPPGSDLYSEQLAFLQPFLDTTVEQLERAGEIEGQEREHRDPRTKAKTVSLTALASKSAATTTTPKSTATVSAVFQPLALTIVRTYCQLDYAMAESLLPRFLPYAVWPTTSVHAPAIALLQNLFDMYVRSRRFDVLLTHILPVLRSSRSGTLFPAEDQDRLPALLDNAMLTSLLADVARYLPFAQVSSILDEFVTELRDHYLVDPQVSARDDGDGKATLTGAKRLRQSARTVDGSTALPCAKPTGPSTRGLRQLVLLLCYLLRATRPEPTNLKRATWETLVAELADRIVVPCLYGQATSAAGRPDQATTDRVTAGLTLHSIIFEDCETYRATVMGPEGLTRLWEAAEPVARHAPRVQVALVSAVFQAASFIVSQPQYYLAPANDKGNRFVPVLTRLVGACLDWVPWLRAAGQHGDTEMTTTAAVVWDGQPFSVTKETAPIALWHLAVVDYLDIVGRFVDQARIDRLLETLLRYAEVGEVSATLKDAPGLGTGWTLSRISLRVLQAASFYEMPSVFNRVTPLLTRQALQAVGKLIDEAAAATKMPATLSRRKQPAAVEVVAVQSALHAALETTTSVSSTVNTEALVAVLDTFTTAGPTSAASVRPHSSLETWTHFHRLSFLTLMLPLEALSADHAASLAITALLYSQVLCSVPTDSPPPPPSTAGTPASKSKRAKPVAKTTPRPAHQMVVLDDYARPWMAGVLLTSELLRRLLGHYSTAQLFGKHTELLPRHLANLLACPLTRHLDRHHYQQPGHAGMTKPQVTQPAPFPLPAEWPLGGVAVLLSRVISAAIGQASCATTAADSTTDGVANLTTALASLSTQVIVTADDSPDIAPMGNKALSWTQVISIRIAPTPAQLWAGLSRALHRHHAGGLSEDSVTRATLRRTAAPLGATLTRMLAAYHAGIRDNTCRLSIEQARTLGHALHVYHAVLLALYDPTTSKLSTAVDKAQKASDEQLLPLTTILALSTAAIHQAQTSAISAAGPKAESSRHSCQELLAVAYRATALLCDFYPALDAVLAQNLQAGSATLTARLLLAHLTAYAQLIAPEASRHTTGHEDEEDERVARAFYGNLLPAFFAALPATGLSACIDQLLRTLDNVAIDAGRDHTTSVRRTDALLAILQTLSRDARAHVLDVVKSRVGDIVPVLVGLLQRTNHAVLVHRALDTLASLVDGRDLPLTSADMVAVMDALSSVSSFAHLRVPTDESKASKTVVAEIFHQLARAVTNILRHHGSLLGPFLPTLLACVGDLFRAFATPSLVDRILLAATTTTTDTSPTATAASAGTGTPADIDTGSLAADELLRLERQRFTSHKPLFTFFNAYSPLPLAQAQELTRLIETCVRQSSFHLHADPIDAAGTTDSTSTRTRHLQAINATAAQPASHQLRLTQRGTRVGQARTVLNRHVPHLLASYFAVQTSDAPILDHRIREALKPALFAVLDVLGDDELDLLVFSLNDTGKTLLQNLLREHRHTYRFREEL
ncbi:hypothetical protein IWQ60_009057 [Tieghemiomyces parasiticus]|uniref:Nucleolar 27S pre-rRNA processing Urb2/Npa2 C-terminal domain-containing protein n=1 Tax=Tieghemiomyces parasiticus TaxID=78921 RepID=A0A9W7ZUD8_9FUNG|nr:hypothetical protein IWQ60_009057 [Tieghemiomyces parasiticus]